MKHDNKSCVVLELAEYFTGPAVTTHSMGLGLEGMQRLTAEQFFKARNALGVNGYATKDEAIRAIGLALTPSEQSK